MSILAVDVGAGTQDIMLYDSEPIEGSVKMVLPSQSVVCSRRIAKARLNLVNILLKGPTMGGGAIVSAIRSHIWSGLKVRASRTAALTINDNLDKVASFGVEIVEGGEEPELGAELIATGDLDLPSLKTALASFEVEVPKRIAVAVQDHGYSESRSNRVVRFEHMRETIRAGGEIDRFAYLDPPTHFNRMTAVRDYLVSLGHIPLLMDTGPAALYGALNDKRCRQPALVVNVGNGHTLAGIIQDDRISALFEHHTSAISPEKLNELSIGLCKGSLTFDDVFSDGGHGAYIDDIPQTIKSVAVTGPRRQEMIPCLKIDKAFEDCRLIEAAPAGDMMMAGCVGLIEAWRCLEG